MTQVSFSGNLNVNEMMKVMMCSMTQLRSGKLNHAMKGIKLKLNESLDSAAVGLSKLK